MTDREHPGGGWQPGNGPPSPAIVHADHDQHARPGSYPACPASRGLAQHEQRHRRVQSAAEGHAKPGLGWHIGTERLREGIKDRTHGEGRPVAGRQNRANQPSLKRPKLSRRRRRWRTNSAMSTRSRLPGASSRRIPGPETSRAGRDARRPAARR